MGIKLFELAKAYQLILESEELTEEEMTTCLNNVEDLFSNKALNIARLVIDLQAESDVLDKEIQRLQTRKAFRDNRIKGLKSYLVTNMEVTGITKAKDNFVSVLLAANPASVVVIDVLQIPSDYWRIIPEQREVDKQKILQTYKDTKTVVPGSDIVKNKHHVLIK